MTPKTRLYGLLLACLLLVAPVMAEPAPENATMTALENVIVPTRDRVDLARRVLGVREISPPPTSPPVWDVGDRKSFWATNSAANRTFQVEATLRAVGEHIYFWVEAGVEIDKATLQEMALLFDREVYEAARTLWGSEDVPGVDGDPRVYGLFAYGMGPNVAAYFSNANTHPQEVVATSNQHEMFFFNLDTLGTIFNAREITGIVAHEFQHMIRAHQDNNEATWVDEGFAKFTELYTGYSYGTLGSAFSFLDAPQTQLNTWAEDGPRQPHYGAAMLFITYFYQRYGEDAMRALSMEQADGLEGFNRVLAALDEPDVNEFFADWALANFLQAPLLEDGRYGYAVLPGMSSAAPEAVITQYPHLRVDEANQYSADYLVLTNLNDVQTLSLTLAAPESVSLVPAQAYSGRWMWYSHRQDESDTMLTRAFDLREVERATLRYRLWYHLEHLWDYGYVMVSADGGESWTPLATAHTTAENPHDNAYGPGYTGTSGGWVEEVIALDEYAGREILVRFEMITDEAVNQPGMLIDDVSIEEIGYFSDFEVDDGGWQAAGWLRTDNVLPQQAWVQAVQQMGDEAQITRWLAPADAAWTLTLAPGVEQVVLAISPFAPVTTVPMPYTLQVALES